MFSSGLTGLDVLLCLKMPAFCLISPEKIRLKSIIPNRDNFRMNYPLEYPYCLFAVEELNRCAVETKVGAKHRFFN